MANKLLITGSVAYDCIETPLAKADYILGGSASYAALAASFFAPTCMASIVGNDFKESDVARLKARGIDLSSLVIDSSRPTFFWRGKYHDNFNSRETLDIKLNVFEDYKPSLADGAKDANFVLLGNISPAVQRAALEAVAKPSFVILDTMDLWINIANAELKGIIPRADILILNDSEAKLLAGTRNIIGAGDVLLKLGAKSVIIKTGEYGAMLFHKDGFFVIPAFPVRALHDPTGAGDSFAGALAGSLAGSGDTSFKAIKNAMIAGAATASLTVESFSCYKLEETGIEEINRRIRLIKQYSQL